MRYVVFYTRFSNNSLPKFALALQGRSGDAVEAVPYRCDRRYCATMLTDDWDHARARQPASSPPSSTEGAADRSSSGFQPDSPIGNRTYVATAQKSPSL